MSVGREFQIEGPATENARSPNLVTVGGTVDENVSVEELLLIFHQCIKIWMEFHTAVKTRKYILYHVLLKYI